MTKYTIRVEEKMREGYRSNFLRRFGRLVDVEKVEKEEALDVTLEQGDTKIEEAYVGLIGMSDRGPRAVRRQEGRRHDGCGYREAL